tara:strand:- start:9645 stop:10394 length:750 start_codon:yes stop_codon:yes gene_type:complete
MRLCVIPDIHNRIKPTQEIIAKELNEVDEFIFLGDYFDHFYDGPEDVGATAMYIKDLYETGKFKFLIGNHDLHYIIDHPALRASTWTREKFDAVNNIIDEDMWSNFLWSYQKGNWLFSHAGINSADYKPENIDDELNSHIENVVENDLTRSEYFSPYGKFWLKYLSNNPPYAATDDGPLNQMIGHTVLANWNMKQLVGYRVYWIDTCSQHYAIIDLEENTVNIKRSDYNHSYHPGEIKWLNRINQIQSL